MKLNFLGGAYLLRSRPLAAQSCINLYLELDEAGGDSQDGALIGTPGLTAKCQLPAGEVRGLRNVNGLLYGVCGSNVFVVNSRFRPTILGQIATANGPVSITDNGTQVLISHPSGWVYTEVGSGSMSNVSGAPLGAIVTEQDGYVIFTKGGDLFGLTGIDSVTSIDPLDFASVEGAPDNIVTVISDHLELWILCAYNSEVWDDTGNALFPFERIPGGLIEMGCAAPFSVTQLDDSLFWLARNKTGGVSVIRTNAYRPLRVSDQGVEFAIAGYKKINDAIAFSYAQEGHAFYQLTFPTADRTWVYDVSTKRWHERSWMDSEGLLHRHRANCYAYFNGEHIVGDFENGKLYSMDLGAFTDDGEVIYRERAIPVPDAERKRVRTDSVELVAILGEGNIAEPDVNPQVWLKVSHDGGYSWGFERFQGLQRMGRRLGSAIWRRCGIGRQTVIRFATTTTTKVAWYGANWMGQVLR